MSRSDLLRLAAAEKMIPNAAVEAQRSVDIAGSVEAVWQTLTGVSEWPRWYPYLKNAKIDGPFAPGASLNYGGLIKHRLRIAKLRRQELVMIYGTLAIYDGITRWDVTQLNENITRVTFTESSDGFLLKQLYSEQSLEEHLRKWLDRLKVAVEQTSRSV